MTGLQRLSEPRALPPAAKLALTAEILGVYARARWILRRADVRAAVARLRAPATEADAGGAEAHIAGLRLGAAVTRVLSPLPVDSRCLMSSLVLCGMLARRGVQCSLVIGVRSASTFGAHSWVELGGRSLLPAEDAEFERLVAL